MSSTQDTTSERENGDMPSRNEIMDCKRMFNRKNIPTPDVEKEWQRFKEKKIAPKVIKNNYKRNAAIGFVTGIAASLLFYFVIMQHPAKQHIDNIQVFNAIDNGDDVLLSSESGKTYTIKGNMADSALLKQGVNATNDSLNYKHSTKRVDSEWMTLTTPRGKDYHVTLPDGSKIWLNAGSKLSFPEQFNGDKRTVKLQGEAFFQIEKNEKQPFEISTEFFTTVVLGTEFNLRAYSKTDAYVVLIQGKVSLYNNDRAQSQVLYPGQKAQWNEEGGFTINKTDTYPYIQWKEGYFYFSNVPLIDILQELGRWYNVNITVENPKHMETRLHFVADRKQDLTFALTNLNLLEVVHASVQNNNVIVK